MCADTSLSSFTPQLVELLADLIGRVGTSHLAHALQISFLTLVQFRLFDQILVSLPSDGSEDLGVILGASKLLDLLLVLQTEEFQM